MKDAIFIYYCSVFSVLIPLIFTFFALRKQKLGIPVLNLMGVLLIISGLSDGTWYVLQKTGYNATFVSNIYYIIQFILISLVFTSLLKKYRRTIYLITLLFLLFVVINSLFFQPITKKQNWTWSFGNIFLIVYPFFYFFSFAAQKITTFLQKDMDLQYGYYFFNAALLLYFSSTLIVFSLINRFSSDPYGEAAVVNWCLHNLANIAKNLLFAVAAWHMGKAAISQK